MIPRIIHQTWKTPRLPRRLRIWRETWLRHHPDWEHRLWTDEDNRNFIKRHYEWFLPLYDSYPEHIMRVDAVRYFILDHYGGVYADLDFECLRAVDTLLENRRLVLGCEPPTNVEHILSGKVAREFGGDLIGNAWLASEAGHPFWKHVHKALIETHGGSDTLETTGPFFLTRTLRSFDDNDSVTVESYEVLYPVGSREAERGRRTATSAGAVDAERMERAYAVHHWCGTWWRRQRVTRRVRYAMSLFSRVWCRAGGWLRKVRMVLSPALCDRYRASWGVRQSARVSVGGGFEESQTHGAHGAHEAHGAHRAWAQLMKNGTCVARMVIELDGLTALASSEGASKSSSKVLRSVCCVMRIGGFRTTQSLQATIDDFHKQSVAKKCLVLLPDHADAAMNEFARQSVSDNVVVADISSASSGDAGNLLSACEREAADIVGGTRGAEYNECAWASWGGYVSHPQRLEIQLAALNATDADVCLLQRRLLLSSHRAGLSPCGALWDSLVCRAGSAQNLFRKNATADRRLPDGNVILVDEPVLSVAPNVALSECADATVTWRGERYDALSKYLRRFYGDIVPLSENDTIRPSQSSQSSQSSQPNQLQGVSSSSPSVLVLTPVKNAAAHITRYIRNLEQIDYPKEKISLAFLESDSDDGTWDHLNLVLPDLRKQYARVELFKKDFNYRPASERWAMNEQLKRRTVMAYSRNALLSRALRDEEWVLWMDVDLLSWPGDALRQLLATGKDIVVPHCVREDGATFDMNTFRLTEDAGQLDWSRYVYDGILQPPAGYGRDYLDACQGLVEVDGVGGTMLLIRADLHRMGLNFPAYPHRYLIETEGLAQVAKDMGYPCWGLADLTVVHVSQ